MQMVQFSQVHFVRKYDSSFELYLQQNIFQQKFWSRIYMHSWGYFASLNMTLFLYISIIYLLLVKPKNIIQRNLLFTDHTFTPSFPKISSEMNSFSILSNVLF